MKVTIGNMWLPELRFEREKTRLIRGYVGNRFKNNDLIHNHDLISGKNLYRYPLIQFKILDEMVLIQAITKEAIKGFNEVFLTLDSLDFKGEKITINEKSFQVKDHEFGHSETAIEYEFVNPWIGLNQENFRLFRETTEDFQKSKLLQKCLTGNIISLAKAFNYEVTERLEIRTNLYSVPVKLKGQTMAGFLGDFSVNFSIPDFLGIGKSVSRGFGVVRRIK